MERMVRRVYPRPEKKQKKQMSPRTHLKFRGEKKSYSPLKKLLIKYLFDARENLKAGW
ncbi:MAG: hypothetical protein ACTSU5_02345 [Promethearchaeota archaeon]